MCGIAAIVRPVGDKAQLTDVTRMVRALAHRGPDGLAVTTCGDGRVALGHARLAIMDPAGGQQPIWSADGSACIVANGELYDHRALRRELEADGLRFHTDSDSEVILGLYLRHGLDALPRMNGEFAFVIWDGRTRRVVAARDRLGVKPLGFAQVGRDVYFGSEAIAIFAAGAVEPRVSPEFLSGPLLGAMRSDLSAFVGVRSLRPGHHLVVSEAGEVHEAAYWRPTFSEAPCSLDAAAERVREALTQAVRRRLVADVPVAAYLSGGLDSTAVAGLIARERGAADVFTLAFHEAALDETADAEATARERGLTLHRVACPPERLADDLVATTLAVEAPITNVNSIAKRVLSGATRAAGYKVVLTGEGADEAFAGYVYFKFEALWRELRKGGAARLKAEPLVPALERMEARTEGALWRRGLPWDAPEHELGFPSIYMMNLGAAEKGVAKLLSPEVLADPLCSSPRASFAAEFAGEDLRALAPLNASRRIAISLLVNFIIPKLGDRVEMANGLEARTPFLDPALWDVALSLPVEHFIDLPRLREKHVLREAVRDLVPKATLARPKHPFVGPSWQSVRKTPRGRELFEAALSRRALRDVGILAPGATRMLLAAWRMAPRGTTLAARLDPVVGSLLSLQLLAQHLPGRVRDARRPEAGAEVTFVAPPARA